VCDASGGIVGLSSEYHRPGGTVSGTPIDSTYVFCRDVLGYDLAGFFRRNSAAIKNETLALFEVLLK